MPDFYVMKQTLEAVFGENQEVNFMNIESMRLVIEQNYTDYEYGVMTGNIDPKKICKTFDEEEKEDLTADTTVRFLNY